MCAWSALGLRFWLPSQSFKLNWFPEMIVNVTFPIANCNQSYVSNAKANNLALNGNGHGIKCLIFLSLR